jgi:hypothetical protein
VLQDPRTIFAAERAAAVPEPTVFGLLGSLAALFLLVNRMRSLCG